MFVEMRAHLNYTRFTCIFHQMSSRIANDDVLQILTVPSKPTSLHVPHGEPITGLRLYPQSWTKQMPTMPLPAFITCNPAAQQLEYTTI